MSKEREPVRWITVKGKHFPVFEDGSVGWQSGREEKPKKGLGSSLKFTKVKSDPLYGDRYESDDGSCYIMKRYARNGTVSFYMYKDNEYIGAVKKGLYDNKSEEEYFNEAVATLQTQHDADNRQVKVMQSVNDNNKNLQSELMKAEFGDAFGKAVSVSPKQRAARLQDLMDNTSVNPHYNDADAARKGYHDNCSLCTMSTIMQLKGYNVEAGVQGTKDTTKYLSCKDIFKPDLTNANNFIMASDKNPYNLSDRNIRSGIRESLKLQGITDEDKVQKVFSEVQSNIKRMPRGAKACSALISDVVSKWDNGAFGEMSVWWRNGNGHSLFIFNDNGTPVVYDMQCGAKKVGASGIEEILKEARANNTEIVRYDNFVGFGYDAKNRLLKAIKKKGE